jgi:hypothetical protein
MLKLSAGTVLAPFESLFSDGIVLSLGGSLTTKYTPFTIVSNVLG